jgi:hypothetical protein
VRPLSTGLKTLNPLFPLLTTTLWLAMKLLAVVAGRRRSQPAGRIERSKRRILMKFTPFGQVTLRVVLTALDIDPEWTGEICSGCNGNRFFISWFVEVQPFLSDKPNEYLVLRKDVCPHCDDLDQVVMHESTERINSLYADSP